MPVNGGWEIERGGNWQKSEPWESEPLARVTYMSLRTCSGPILYILLPPDDGMPYMPNFMAWLVRKQPVHDVPYGLHDGPWSSVPSLLYVDMETQFLWPCNKPEAISQKNHYLWKGMAMLKNPKDLLSNSFVRGCQSLNITAMCQRHMKHHEHTLSQGQCGSTACTAISCRAFFCYEIH